MQRSFRAYKRASFGWLSSYIQGGQPQDINIVLCRRRTPLLQLYHMPTGKFTDESIALDRMLGQ